MPEALDDGGAGTVHLHEARRPDDRAGGAEPLAFAVPGEQPEARAHRSHSARKGGPTMTAVAPWLTATVYFVDLDRLPRDVRLEVRTAGRLVVATAYEAVASYAFSYARSEGHTSEPQSRLR